jgi:2-methylisocitrate lyase-like PEP mutase family enzyme
LPTNQICFKCSDDTVDRGEISVHAGASKICVSAHKKLPLPTKFVDADKKTSPKNLILAKSVWLEDWREYVFNQFELTSHFLPSNGTYAK